MTVLAGALLLPSLAPAVTVLTNANEAALDKALSDGGEIFFTFDGTITLTTPKVITANTVLNATGRSVRLSGGSKVRPFMVNSGVTLTLSNLTLANGQSIQSGGAIFNSGRLVLGSCVFSNNAALGSRGISGSAGNIGSVLGSNGGPGGPGGAAEGGAIFNEGTALIDRCTFITNRAVGGVGGGGGSGGAGGYSGGQGGNGGDGGNAMGGAIFSSGVLQLSSSLFQSNTVTGGGGGTGGTNGGGQFPLANGDGGGGGWAGGGAVCAVGTSTFNGLTLWGNSAHGGSAADAATNSQNTVGVTGRSGADGYGGSLFTGGTNTLVNCTFATNAAAGGNGGKGGNGSPWAGNGGPGGNAWGGSWFNSATNLGKSYATNCTFASGQSTGGAGGAAGAGPLAGTAGTTGSRNGDNIENLGAILFLKNTLLAFGTAANGNDAITDGQGNLSTDSTPISLAAGRRNISLSLLPLKLNGGTTPTMALPTRSPAIDAGSAGAPATDQRGARRPFGGSSDVGAFEYWPLVPTLRAGRSNGGTSIVGSGGTAGQSCRLQFSTNLNTWTTVATNQISSDGTVHFSDPTGGPQGFYRLRMP